MSLEQKAVRFADLIIETNRKYGNSWNQVKAKIENQKWVKLEDAQEIEEENQVLKNTYQALYDTFQDITKQIDLANKILDDLWRFNHVPNKQIILSEDDFNRLRACLSQEQKKEVNP